MAPLVALTMLVSVAEASTRLTVVTTIAQIAEPLRAVVGDRASVENLMGEGVGPLLYRLTRSDMLRLTHADVIFWNGLHLEAQTEDALERLGTIKTVVSITDALAAD
jgi:manganese/zinc/iron transport system substrate-binding protein